MDRINSRISQVYGYAVCLITVIVMLIAIKQVVNAAFDLSDPIRADGGGYGRMGRPITNFELYRMEARQQASRGMARNPRCEGVGRLCFVRCGSQAHVRRGTRGSYRQCALSRDPFARRKSPPHRAGRHSLRGSTGAGSARATRFR